MTDEHPRGAEAEEETTRRIQEKLAKAKKRAQVKKVVEIKKGPTAA